MSRNYFRVQHRDGPSDPWTLKRKLLLTGFGVVLLLAGLVLNYYVNPTEFNGKASGWMLNFSLISLFVFLVSAYCLSIAHFPGFLNNHFLKDNIAEGTESKHVLV